jgi:hypothetical protein
MYPADRGVGSREGKGEEKEDARSIESGSEGEHTADEEAPRRPRKRNESVSMKAFAEFLADQNWRRKEIANATGIPRGTLNNQKIGLPSGPRDPAPGSGPRDPAPGSIQWIEPGSEAERRTGGKRPRGSYTEGRSFEEAFEQAKELAKTGLSRKDIAAATGVSRDTLKKRGVVLTSRKPKRRRKEESSAVGGPRATVLTQGASGSGQHDSAYARRIAANRETTEATRPDLGNLGRGHLAPKTSGAPQSASPPPHAAQDRYSHPDAFGARAHADMRLRGPGVPDWPQQGPRRPVDLVRGALADGTSGAPQSAAPAPYSGQAPYSRLQGPGVPPRDWTPQGPLPVDIRDASARPLPRAGQQQDYDPGYAALLARMNSSGHPYDGPDNARSSSRGSEEPPIRGESSSRRSRGR